MFNRHAIRGTRSIAVLAGLCLCVFVHPASAGSVSLTLTSTNLTVAENGTLTLNFDLSNTTGATISLDGTALCNSGFCGNGPETGDPSDSVFSFGPLPSSCSTLTSLADGSSCTWSFAISASGDTGETDNDFGLNPMGLFITYDCPVAGGGQCLLATNLFTVKVTDSSTPEPASLLLLGTGLLGLGPFLRARFARET